MKMHPQIITNTKDKLPEFIVLPYHEYVYLLDALEDQDDQEDIEAIKEFQAGNKETIPLEILKAIEEGESAIRAFREFRKISQTDLAKKVGVSRQYLCQIEKKERQGNIKLIKKIAEVLDIDIDLIVAQYN